MNDACGSSGAWASHPYPDFRKLQLQRQEKKFRTAPSRQTESAQRYPPSQTSYLRPSNVECKQKETFLKRQNSFMPLPTHDQHGKICWEHQLFCSFPKCFQQARWRSAVGCVPTARRTTPHTNRKSEFSNLPYVSLHLSRPFPKAAIAHEFCLRKSPYCIHPFRWPFLTGLSQKLSAVSKNSWFPCHGRHCTRLQIFSKYWWNRIPGKAYLWKFNLVIR